MGKRISAVTTKTGDKGTTGLGDGTRVSKASLRINAIGDIDELNCALGIICAHRGNILISDVQHRLFDIGGELSIPEYVIIDEGDVKDLDNSIIYLNSKLPPLDNFILPGGNEEVARIHMARAICRRAERSMVALHDIEPINPASIKFINRLSDYLFVWARFRAESEILWKPKGSPDV